MDELLGVMERLDTNYSKFSKGQRRIADFIRENYDKAAYYTAAKLGAEVGVSESTVVRFATELDYEGYPQLQKAIAATVRTHSNSIQRLENIHFRMENENDLLAVLMKEDCARIKEAENSMDPEIFEKVVDTIVNAENIYILGVRSAWYLAGMLGYYFRMIFTRVNVLEGSGNVDTLEEISRMKEKDVLIGISFPRYSVRTTKAMELAKKNRATTITLTDSMQSPLIEYADYPLIAKSDVIGIVDSLTAAVSVINALVVAVSIRKKDELESHLHVLEELWNEYKVYDDHVID